MTTLERFKKAVVNIRCGDGSPAVIRAVLQERAGIMAKERRGEVLSPTEEQKLREPLPRMVLGTALLLEDHSRRYLVTARHVIRDDSSGAVSTFVSRIRSFDEPPIQIQHTDSQGNVISDYDVGGDLLTHLSAGPRGQCTFHDKVDIAVISLSGGQWAFSRMLNTLGMQPIPLDEVAGGPSGEGAEVVTVGFPGDLSVVGQQGLPEAVTNWVADEVSLPVSSFGRVSMLNANLPFYLCDLSVLPGNSGGPVFEGSRVVGIVSGQPAIPVETLPKIPGGLDLRTPQGQRFCFVSRWPFTNVIKSSYIREVLATQREKDKLCQGS
jgi:S1-C subfamily serine protease